MLEKTSKKVMLALLFCKTERLTWAKLARTRRGKVAKMRRETLHSTMKATMNEVRREVMFCSMTDILSAIADFTSAASVANRAATRLELCSSSSNHPTSFLKIADQENKIRLRSKSKRFSSWNQALAFIILNRC
jgi:hypothetical protein